MLKFSSAITLITILFRAKLEALKLVEIEAKTLRVGIHERDSLIASLETELKSERDSNKRLVEEKNEVENKYNKHKDSWLQESNKLAEELKTSKECYEMAIEGEIILICNLSLTT